MKKMNFLIIFFVLSTLLNGCKKDVEQKQVESTAVKQIIKLGNKKNPFSLKNIREVKNKKLQNTAQRAINNPDINVDRVWVYVQFNPEKVTGDILAKLEADADIHIMDIPFANFELYNDDFALDEEKAELLKDGKLYAVYKKNSAINDLFISENILETRFLDELYLPEESEIEDVDLYMQALLQAGYSQEQANRWFNICLFKRPAGYVRYWDENLPNGSGSTGRLEPVRNMQVWGLVFGIPIHTYTDNSGHYTFPFRFSVGTIMGTKAKNDIVNVKPFNTVGGFFQVTGQLISNFIVGSVYIKGWVGSCAMRDEVNFDFYDHKQNKYWSIILNAYAYHDDYCASDGINNAPQGMVCYAHWADALGIGAASTPMLGQLTGGPNAGIFINFFFGNSVSGPILSLVQGLLPDMTFKVCGKKATSLYTTRLTQTAFHELGHASHFRQVSSGWWVDLDWAELTHNCPNTTNFYCDGNYPKGGHVQVAESWAEFQSMSHTLRRYPNGQVTGSSGAFRGQITAIATLLENEEFFQGPSNWMPYGFFYDLQDNFRIAETWDNVNGITMAEMYNVLGTDVQSMCDYINKAQQTNPSSFNTNNINVLFRHYILACP